jgi:hypothetical protein
MFARVGDQCRGGTEAATTALRVQPPRPLPDEAIFKPIGKLRHTSNDVCGRVHIAPFARGFPGIPSRFTKTRHRHRLLAAGKRTNTMPRTSETCATGRKGPRPPAVGFYVKQRIVAPHRKTYSPSQNEQEAQREGENTRMSVPAFASF